MTAGLVPAIHKASKDHLCYWCGETIKEGEIYTGWRTVDESGKGHITRCHNECAEVWQSATVELICYAGFGEHSRGCGCAKGNCQCANSIETVPVHTDLNDLQ